MSFSSLEHLKPNAKFLVIAKITFPLNSTKADEFEQRGLAMQKAVNSGKEPGTLMFRLSRGISPDERHKFTGLEEYANKEAYEQHQTSEAFEALTASKVLESADTQRIFRQECV
ncbi:hypothetical protein PQX77_021123 [Marasmius sp. AFHP31]|nr:hypothetical protein PQX77_021123 [Marasmius sp. AFHP31]